MRAAALLLVAAGQLMAAAAMAQQVLEPVDPAPGRDLAERLCSRCHAVGKEGPSAMPAAVPFRDLKTLYPIESLAEALAEGMTTGHPDMPEVQLPPPMIDSFLAYLQGL